MVGVVAQYINCKLYNKSWLCGIIWQNQDYLLHSKEVTIPISHIHSQKAINFTKRSFKETCWFSVGHSPQSGGYKCTEIEIKSWNWFYMYAMWHCKGRNDLSHYNKTSFLHWFFDKKIQLYQTMDKFGFCQNVQIVLDNDLIEKFD
jgi:hypothetical protein